MEKKNIFAGIIFDGIGEGAKYVKLYEKEIEKLGFKPFYGTLNIEIDKKERETLLKSIKQTIKISGFSKQGIRYGEIKCYNAYDKNNDELLIVVPEKTRYKSNVLEIISNFNLRRKFNLKEGDIFRIKINKNT